MRNMLIGVALLAGVGTVAPMQASAQDLELQIGRDGLRIERDCNPRYEDCYYGGDRRYESRRSMRRCTEGRALDKAERMGIRRARIETSAGAPSKCAGATATASASTSHSAASRTARS